MKTKPATSSTPKKIYAITSSTYRSGEGRQFRAFFSSLEIAKEVFRAQVNSIESRICHVTHKTDMKFSFYFGWEESGATWEIIEIELIDNVEIGKKILVV